MVIISTPGLSLVIYKILFFVSTEPPAHLTHPPIEIVFFLKVVEKDIQNCNYLSLLKSFSKFLIKI